MMEMLTSVLAGGVLCFEMAKQDGSGIDALGSKLFLAMCPEAFGDRGRFEARVEDLLEYLRQSVAGGLDEATHYPGQNSWRSRDRYLVEGIPLDPQTVAELAAEGVGVEAIP